MSEAYIYNPSIEVGNVVPLKYLAAIVLAVKPGEFADVTLTHWNEIVEELTGGQASPPAHPPEQGGGPDSFYTAQIDDDPEELAERFGVHPPALRFAPGEKVYVRGLRYCNEGNKPGGLAIVNYEGDPENYLVFGTCETPEYP